MVEYLQVFLSILCDTEIAKAQKLQACTNVQEELAALGITRSHIVNNRGVADITAIAEIEESEIPSMLAKIRAIKGVKSVDARTLVFA